MLDRIRLRQAILDQLTYRPEALLCVLGGRVASSATVWVQPAPDTLDARRRGS